MGQGDPGETNYPEKIGHTQRSYILRKLSTYQKQSYPSGGGKAISIRFALAPFKTAVYRQISLNFRRYFLNGLRYRSPVTRVN